jgi:hypothetical protein
MVATGWQTVARRNGFNARGPAERTDPRVPIVACGMPMSEIADALFDDMVKRVQGLPRDASPEQLAALVPDKATSNALLAKISDKPGDEFR